MNLGLTSWLLIGFVAISAIIVSKIYIDVEKISGKQVVEDASLQDIENNDASSSYAYVFPSPDITTEKNIYNYAVDSSRNIETHGELMEPFASSGPQQRLQTVSTSIDTGLTIYELKELHARQLQKIKQTYSNLEEIIIEPINDQSEGVKLRELKELHEQQMHEIKKSYEHGTIILRSTKDDLNEIQRSDLAAFHSQQQLEIEKSKGWDEVVIKSGEDGSAGLTRTELARLHAQQLITKDDGTVHYDHVGAPSGEDGGTYLTIHDLRELHKEQSGY